MMGSQERSRKKIHTWKKATLHFLLCFVMGFFTGFTPTSKAWRSSTSSHFAIPPLTNSPHSLPGLNHSSKTEIDQPNHEKLVIIISPIKKRNKASNVLLRRLANTLRLVSQPLLWVIVEQKPHDPEVSEILRKTGIMYRHIVSDEEFRDEDSETDHQRNLAISHIERHRLSGVVHFAGLSNVYDLTFFQEIRAIE